MDQQPHDSFAKLVLGKLARGREFIPEAELRPKVYADVVLRPGPCIPAWVGLLGRLIAEGLTVFEVFHGRPRNQDLCHAQAKGALALATELERNPGFAGARKSRVIAVTIGTPRRAMKRCFSGRWASVGPGYRRHEGAQEFLHLDLLRLPVTADTAWAHVVGNSPLVDEALTLLLTCGKEESKELLYSMREEVSYMPELQKRMPDPGRTNGAYRFLKAWELAASRIEGREEGREEGRLSEAREAVLKVAELRFEEAKDALSPQLERIQTAARLEELLETAVLTPTLEALVERAEAMEAEESARDLMADDGG